MICNFFQESQPIPEPLVDNGSAELEDASPAKKQKIANDVEVKTI